MGCGEPWELPRQMIGWKSHWIKSDGSGAAVGCCLAGLRGSRSKGHPKHEREGAVKIVFPSLTRRVTERGQKDGGKKMKRAGGCSFFTHHFFAIF